MALFQAIKKEAFQPLDAASLAAFRVFFGLMMCAGVIRFAAYGWIDRFFVKPGFYFKFWGFEWVEIASPTVMYAVFGGLALSAFLVAIGFLYRIAIVVFFLLFTYVELIDVSNYLNHYYLVSLLAFILIFLPANRVWSVDARIRPPRFETVPAWMLWWMRFQVGCVYFYAGIAKFKEDWLIHAQPLNLWLTSRVETPFIGPLLQYWETALVMSWAGFLFDTTIVFWLLWRKSRPWAYIVLIVFHLLTNVFFAIGLFPVIMIVAATVFFEPNWPRRFLGGRPTGRLLEAERGPVWVLLIALVFCVFQGLMPWRHLVYPGSVLWNEEGMRWSWKVMLREKNGDVVYRVKLGERVREVSPRFYLSADQEREMSGQPDLILQLAHHIADEYTHDGQRPEVYADVWVSWNGRKRARLIDPSVNLAEVDDGVWPPAPWILPEPETSPFRPKGR